MLQPFPTQPLTLNDSKTNYAFRTALESQHFRNSELATLLDIEGIEARKEFTLDAKKITVLTN